MNRPNILLVVAAVLGVLFGAYGLMSGGSGPAQRAPGETPSLAEAPQESGTAADTPGVGKDTPVKSREPQPATNDNPATVPETPVAPAIKPHTRGDAVLEGTVIDPQGTPIAGITVSVREDRSASRGRATPEEWRAELERLLHETFQAVSDEQGKFRVEGLARGERYQVSATSERWGKAFESAYAGEPLFLQFSDVPVTAGTVEDGDGNPVVGYVIAWVDEDQDYNRGNRQYDAAFTARWERAYAGFRIECPGFQPCAVMDNSFKGQSDVRVVLARAPVLEFVVTAPSGDPVPRAMLRISRARVGGAQVQLSTLDATTPVTDLDGRAQFRTLPPGEYDIVCTLGKSQAIANVTLEKDSVVPLTLDPGAGLVVRVLSAEGKPVAGTSIGARDAAGEWIACGEISTGQPGETRVLGLPAGPMQLEISAPDYPAHWLDVDLSSGTQTVELTLKKGGTLKGHVTDAAGNPLSRILLKLLPPGGAAAGRDETTWSNEAGEFTSRPLLPGAWTVELYRDWSGARLAVANAVIAEGENTQDFMLENACILKVILEADTGLASDWCTIWILADGDETPTAEWISGDANHERSLTLDAGIYHVSANSDDLASPTREVNVVPGVTTLRLRLSLPNALRFTWVEPGSELAKAGIEVGDLLVEYNGQPVTSKAELNRLTAAAAELNEVPAVVMRGSRRLEVKMPKMAFHYWMDPAVR
jgi:protocatechuate 3,4-dioxygenase beta subunit